MIINYNCLVVNIAPFSEIRFSTLHPQVWLEQKHLGWPNDADYNGQEWLTLILFLERNDWWLSMVISMVNRKWPNGWFSHVESARTPQPAELWPPQRQPTVGRCGWHPRMRLQRESSTDLSVGITPCASSLNIACKERFFVWTFTWHQFGANGEKNVVSDRVISMQQQLPDEAVRTQPLGSMVEATNVDIAVKHTGSRLVATYWNARVRTESAIKLDILNWTIQFILPKEPIQEVQHFNMCLLCH